jgi:hypothetical protein
MRAYLDSVVLVDYLDHAGPFQVRAANRLAALAEAGDQIVVSNLVRMECRMDPIRRGDQARLQRFDGFFALPDIAVAPLTPSVFDRAAEIRAQYS